MKIFEFRTPAKSNSNIYLLVTNLRSCAVIFVTSLHSSLHSVYSVGKNYFVPSLNSLFGLLLWKFLLIWSIIYNWADYFLIDLEWRKCYVIYSQLKLDIFSIGFEVFGCSLFCYFLSCETINTSKACSRSDILFFSSRFSILSSWTWSFS